MIRLISYADIRSAPILLDEYAEECSIAAIGKPNPQWEMYERMEDAGALQCFGVFSDGCMVGFATLLMHVLPHYGVRTAGVESLFVSKSHRRGGAGKRLMDAIERHAEHVGKCAAIMYSAPAGSRLEELLGYKYARTNSVYARPLG